MIQAAQTVHRNRPWAQYTKAITDADGWFQINSPETTSADVSLYLVAKGGEPAVNKSSGRNPTIALSSVLGNTPPSTVIINEMAIVASVWTNAQFLDGDAIKGALWYEFSHRLTAQVDFELLICRWRSKVEFGAPLLPIALRVALHHAFGCGS